MNKILVIDDDINALKLLGYTLRKAGFDVVVAQNGFEGLEKAESHLPDLIVSDLMMPKIDGYEVTRRLRANPATGHIPIIMLTAKSQVQDKVAGFEAGVNDYVTKPVMPVELIARIRAHLSRPAVTPGTPATPKARRICFLGVKGGVGLTTLMVNLGLAIQQEGKQVILLDFQTSSGTVCQQLGLASNNNLLNLLQKSPTALTPDALGRALLAHKSGLKALPPTHGVYARYRPLEFAHAKTIMNTLDASADYLMVDLGITVNKTAEGVLKNSHMTCLISEPNLLALDLTKRVIQYLNDIGVAGQNVGVVLVNRSRSAHTFTLEQLKEALKIQIWGIISAAPELAFQASQSKTPMFTLQPNNVTIQQMKELTPVLT